MTQRLIRRRMVSEDGCLRPAVVRPRDANAFVRAVARSQPELAVAIAGSVGATEDEWDLIEEAAEDQTLGVAWTFLWDAVRMVIATVLLPLAYIGLGVRFVAICAGVGTKAVSVFINYGGIRFAPQSVAEHAIFLTRPLNCSYYTQSIYPGLEKSIMRFWGWNEGKMPWDPGWFTALFVRGFGIGLLCAGALAKLLIEVPGAAIELVGCLVNVATAGLVWAIYPVYVRNKLDFTLRPWGFSLKDYRDGHKDRAHLASL